MDPKTFDSDWHCFEGGGYNRVVLSRVWLAYGRKRQNRPIDDHWNLRLGAYPVYTAFFLLNTGFLILQANWWLMVLPFCYWLALSILLKYTEERWLQEKFGAQYARYAARVNRVFPWPPRGPKGLRLS